MKRDLRALILSAAPVTDLVGQRVSWSERPQGSPMPAIVLWLISQPRAYVLEGALALTQSRVQADCWGLTFASANAVGDAVMALLDGYSGDHGSTRFDGVFQDTARDTRDAGTDDAVRYFRSSVDFIVNHQPKE